jgi:hypothetical protein
VLNEIKFSDCMTSISLSDISMLESPGKQTENDVKACSQRNKFPTGGQVFYDGTLSFHSEH